MRRSGPRTIRSTIAAVLLVPVAIALAGCDPDQVGTAAAVKGDPVSIEELQATTQEFLAVVPTFDENEAQQKVLNNLILSRVLQAAAERTGVRVSKAEAAAVRDQALEEFGGRNKLVRTLAQGEGAQVLAPSYIDQAARDILIQNKIVQKLANGRDPNSPEVGQEFAEAISAAGRSLNIKVNPRYGSWDNRRIALNPIVGGGLSKSLTELREAAGR